MSESHSWSLNSGQKGTAPCQGSARTTPTASPSITIGASTAPYRGLAARVRLLTSHYYGQLEVYDRSWTKIFSQPLPMSGSPSQIASAGNWLLVASRGEGVLILEALEHGPGYELVRKPRGP